VTARRAVAVLFAAVLAPVLVAACEPASTAGGDTAPAAADGPPDGVPSGAQRAELVADVDGDTLRARATAGGDVLPGGDEVRVRLLQVDAPEIGERAECFGPEAADAVADLVPVGAEVWVDRDREARDRYGRELLYVWAADGTFVNRTLVADGYATSLLVEPTDRYIDQMRAAEREARGERRGLWAVCPPA
jgi:micrococcal nuclease